MVIYITAITWFYFSLCFNTQFAAAVISFEKSECFAYLVMKNVLVWFGQILSPKGKHGKCLALLEHGGKRLRGEAYRRF